MTRILAPALGAAVVAVLLLAMVALAAEPSALPSAVPGELLQGGDPRSEGEGPGLVGNPLLILGVVVVLGLVTAMVTVILARLLRRD
jgi:hypothetical protein